MNNRLILLVTSVVMLSLSACCTCAPPPSSSPGNETHAENRRERYVAKHPELPPEVKRAILQGTIVKTMTKDDVRVSWGTPLETKENQTSEGSFSKWIYHKNNRNVTLYFHRGRLNSWK